MGKKSTSHFKNIQLDSTFAKLVNKVGEKHCVKVRQLAADRAEEVQFSRFLNNKNVTWDGIIDQYWQNSTINFSDKHILVINDSSTMSYLPNQRRQTLGRVGANTKKEGFNIHPSIMVNAMDGACLGLGGLQIYQNTDPAPTKPRAYSKPFEENERYKWYASPAQSIKNCSGALSYTLVGDRESDIYDLIAATLDQNWQFLYRCRTDRKLEDSGSKLYDTINSWPVKHTYDLEVASTKKRTAHTANLNVKFGTVAIKRSKDHPNKDLPKSLSINVIEVREQACSVIGTEKPIHWILLTSHPIDTLEQVLTIIQWYCWRWIIEQLFRALKSKGLDAQKAEQETFHALSNMVTIALLAAIQVMQLVQARDGQTDQRIEEGFDAKEQVCLDALNEQLEGKTAKQKNPHPKQSLAYATWIIARLGGWKGYRSEKPAGPITITKGLNRFYDILKGFYLKI